MKCSYKYCKEGCQVEKDEAIYENKKYYHLICYEKKELKNKIAEAFFDYVKNNEDGLFIRKIISKYVDTDNINPSYVYYSMMYAVENKIPLKSIFGLGYIMKQDKVKKSYEEILNKYKNIKIKPENVDYVYRKELKGGWGEMFG